MAATNSTPAMTRRELRVFLQDWFCGCGSPDAAADTLRILLALHPLHSNREAFEALVPNNGIQYLLLYTLDQFDLTEHGGNVGGGWLTDKGHAVLAALDNEKADDYEALFAMSCAHGYAVDEPIERPEIVDCTECVAINADMKQAPSPDTLPILTRDILEGNAGNGESR
jgi:hypothetical protein